MNMLWSLYDFVNLVVEFRPEQDVKMLIFLFGDYYDIY